MKQIEFVKLCELIIIEICQSLLTVTFRSVVLSLFEKKENRNVVTISNIDHD